ncbi:hypothetical protein, partial [Bifidobacterium lemurum]|uniref:hypothetical protein n=1 Tax=Bifidobacterium lemurum TaxID=1603886 RepID=UPI001968872C
MYKVDKNFSVLSLEIKAFVLVDSSLTMNHATGILGGIMNVRSHIAADEGGGVAMRPLPSHSASARVNR